MKQLIIPDKVQKEMLTDFMILGETRGLIGGYCEDEFPVYYSTFGPAMLPSLLICPMRITGVPVSLANFKREAVHSLTCTMLPGEESIFSVEIVWMESMMTKSGAAFFIWVKICSNEVSQAISRLSFSGCGMRTARSLSWRALSSPDT